MGWIPLGSISNNILTEPPLKMSTVDTNWQNQRGRRPLYHCAAFKTYQSVTAAWMESDSRGDRDISFCLRHSNEVWRRLTNISQVCVWLPVWYYRGFALNLKQPLTEGKQLFTQVCADGFLYWLNICVAVLVLFLRLRWFPVQSSVNNTKPNTW